MKLDPYCMLLFSVLLIYFIVLDISMLQSAFFKYKNVVSPPPKKKQVSCYTSTFPIMATFIYPQGGHYREVWLYFLFVF